MLKVRLLGFLLLFYFLSSAQEEYPQLTQIVTDNAAIFTQPELEGMRAKLTQFETETTNQLVVLTINELGAETIEEYANGVFNQNRLGQGGKDNGILILFSKLDREVRIEVGYGLESYITDAVASRIIRNTMVPQFKEDDYFGGLDRATDQIIEFLKNPEALEEFNQQIAEEGEMPWWGLVMITGFLSIFMAAGGFVFYKGYSALVEMFRGIFIGKLGIFPAIFMCIPTLMIVAFGLVFILMPIVLLTLLYGFDFDPDNIEVNSSWGYFLLLGFFVVTIALAILKIVIKGKEDFKLSWVKSDSKYMSKTFSSGGSHSFGSGSSSGGSSSSFSGGGGSSGGGGASGSW